MAVTLGNPIIITSGTTNTLILNQNMKIKNAYWYDPTVESTSSLIISREDAAGDVLFEAHPSNTDQRQWLVEQWWKKPFVRCVPTGTLYVYLK
tara:strand:- start:4819 stop:5097 length:279 start_codon:yes stop_codon:yes gene_type:complete